MVVVVFVLGMLPLNKLCKEKSPDPKRLLVWTGHSLKGLLALYSRKPWKWQVSQMFPVLQRLATGLPKRCGRAGSQSWKGLGYKWMSAVYGEVYKAGNILISPCPHNNPVYGRVFSFSEKTSRL